MKNLQMKLLEGWIFGISNLKIYEKVIINIILFIIAANKKNSLINLFIKQTLYQIIQRNKLFVPIYKCKQM